MKKIDFLQSNYSRALKLFYYATLFREEFKFIDKDFINPEIYRQMSLVNNGMHLLRQKTYQINSKSTSKVNLAIQDLDVSNEKIWAIMSCMNKLMLMSEEDCLRLESMIELDEI
jgi:hypothetical protein